MKANGVFAHNKQTQPGKNVSFPVNLGVSVSPGCLNQRGRAVSAYSLAPRPGTPGSVEKLALGSLWTSVRRSVRPALCTRVGRDLPGPAAQRQLLSSSSNLYFRASPILMNPGWDSVNIIGISEMRREAADCWASDLDGGVSVFSFETF